MRFHIKTIVTKLHHSAKAFNALVLKNKTAFFILLLGAVLRLYNLGEHITFLGDQGRDATIIKRILTLEHFPAIGAPTSIGQIYLGPFYYYFISPFLLLFNFNPLGLAIGVALWSILFSIAAYYVIQKELGSRTGIIFAFITSFSAVLILFARFSWNPNLLPYFAFFTIYFFYKSLFEKKLFYPLLFGALFSFSFQLHYLAGLLVFPFAFLSGWFIYKKNTKLDLVLKKKFLLSCASFIFFSIPLVIFDLRHQFLNTHNFIKLFTQSDIVNKTSFLSRFMDTVGQFVNHTTGTLLPPLLSVIIIIGIAVMGIIELRKRPSPFFLVYFVSFYLSLPIFSLLNSARFEHYYGPLYISFFTVLAYLLSRGKKTTLVPTLLCLSMVLLYLFSNSAKFAYIFSPGNKQIQHAERVAHAIEKNITQMPYQMVAVPHTESDGQYRYFLEIYGKTPIAFDALGDPKELFVLCFEKIEANCSIIGNPQWQIAAFTNAKIQKSWRTDGITIYKLVKKN